MKYLRFFLNYNDGAGWKDMGMAAVNVHDLPDSKDCNGALEKPLSYVVRLKVDPKNLPCGKTNLPKLPLMIIVPLPALLYCRDCLLFWQE